MSVFLPNLFGSLMDHPLYQDLLLPSQQLCSPSVTPTPKSPKMPKVQTPRDTYPINWSPSRVDFFNLGVVPAPWDAPDQGEESTVGNRSRKRSLEELDSEPEEDLPTLEELFGNVTDLSQLAAAPQVDSHTSASCQGSEPYINSLDYLLWEKREQPLEQEQERLLLQDPLDLRPSDVNKDSVLLTPEHRMLVERFSVSLKVIPQMHPGETIFLPRHHPPPCFLDSSNLKPHNPLEELFLSASPVQQLSFLHSGLLSNLYLHTSDLPVPLLQWLFQLLTWPPETSSKAFGLLWELSVHGLFCQSDKDIHLWCPSLQDILEVFHGLGAHDLTLCPQGPLQHGTRVLECDIQEQQDPPQEVALDMSLSYVYKFLMLCILARPRAYTDASLLGLLELLCRTSLDMGLCLLPKTDLQQLLLLLLDRIDEWPGKLQWLCCMLSCMSNHHHNLLALVRFFPDSTSRSRQLRSQLSLVVIARILGQEEVLTVWSEKSQLSLLSQFLCLMRPSSLGQYLGSKLLPPCQEQQTKASIELDHKVCYLCHSLLSLAGVVVSSQDFTPDQWGELQLLCMQLDRHINNHIRESPQAMYRTKLKDLATQTYIRWQELLAYCRSQAQYFSPWKDI